MWSRMQYFARETTISLRRNLLMTIAGILTVAVSLALFGGIMLLSQWVDHGTTEIKGGVRLEVFMAVPASNEQIADVRGAIEDDPQIKDYRFLTKADALEEFKRIFKKDQDLVKNVDAESLPTSFRVVPEEAEFTEAIKARFEPLAGVDSVETPEEALRGLLSATDTARLIFIGLSVVLLVSSLFLIVNTIRLATFARRREIEVMKLVGASNWFVRGPFMLEGLLCGLAGSAVAVLLLYLGKEVALPAILGHINTSDDVHALSFGATAIALMAVGLGVGALGSGMTLRRFLKV